MQLTAAAHQRLQEIVGAASGNGPADGDPGRGADAGALVADRFGRRRRAGPAWITGSGGKIGASLRAHL